MNQHQFVYVDTKAQRMTCKENDVVIHTFPVSTAKNGLGEQMGSECTPRGWHRIASILGRETPVNSVFVARKWTGEIYSEALAQAFPDRDWILTCIMQLEGMEEGRNKGGEVDSLARYIYIHGTPDSTVLGIPGSRGCIRMQNEAILTLAGWAQLETCVFIE